jgi:hypothetical protein
VQPQEEHQPMREPVGAAARLGWTLAAARHARRGKIVDLDRVQLAHAISKGMNTRSFARETLGDKGDE